MDDESKAMVAAARQPLMDQLAKILTMLDDALAPEDGGASMHSHGQTPDWFVEAAHFATYGVEVGQSDDAIAALKRVREEARREEREACAQVADEKHRICKWEAGHDGNDMTLRLRASYGTNIAKGISLAIRERGDK